MKKINGFTIAEVLLVCVLVSAFMMTARIFFVANKNAELKTKSAMKITESMPDDVNFSNNQVKTEKQVNKVKKTNTLMFDEKSFTNDFDKNDMGFVVTKMHKKKKNTKNQVTLKEPEKSFNEAEFSMSNLKGPENNANEVEYSMSNPKEPEKPDLSSAAKSNTKRPSSAVCCSRDNISSRCLIRTDKDYMTKKECEAKKTKLGIKNCTEDVDHWAKGVEKCGHVDNMVDEETLAKIANDVYETDLEIQPRDNNTTVKGYDKTKWERYFGKEGYVGVWANVESGGNYVGRSHWRYFGKPGYVGDLGTPAGDTGWRGNGIRSLKSETRYTYCICN